MIRTFILGWMAVALYVSPAWAQEDAERGRMLAEKWCTTCHVVADDVPGGTIGPAFSVMTTLRGRSEEQLSGWLASPHKPMPDFNLSGREIADIVAYISSLGE